MNDSERASAPAGEEPRDWKRLMQLIGPAEIVVEVPTTEPFGHRQRLGVRAGDMLEIRLAALHSRSSEKLSLTDLERATLELILEVHDDMHEWHKNTLRGLLDRSAHPSAPSSPNV